MQGNIAKPQYLINLKDGITALGAAIEECALCLLYKGKNNIIMVYLLYKVINTSYLL